MPAIVALLEGSDLILVLGAPVFTYHVEGDGPHIPHGAALVQLTDDPGAASWCPVGTSIVTNLKLGVCGPTRLRPRDPRATPALQRAPRHLQPDRS